MIKCPANPERLTTQQRVNASRKLSWKLLESPLDQTSGYHGQTSRHVGSTITAAQDPSPSTHSWSPQSFYLWCPRSPTVVEGVLWPRLSLCPPHLGRRGSAGAAAGLGAGRQASASWLSLCQDLQGLEMGPQGLWLLSCSSLPSLGLPGLCVSARGVSDQ